VRSPDRLLRLMAVGPHTDIFEGQDADNNTTFTAGRLG
jgi:hypothetical protein